MSIALHEEVDTFITGQRTFVVADGARELARVLPGGRVLINGDVTIAEIVRACVQQCAQSEAERAASLRSYYDRWMLVQHECIAAHAENARLRSQLTADLGTGE